VNNSETGPSQRRRPPQRENGLESPFSTMTYYFARTSRRTLRRKSISKQAHNETIFLPAPIKTRLVDLPQILKPKKYILIVRRKRRKFGRKQRAQCEIKPGQSTLRVLRTTVSIARRANRVPRVGRRLAEEASTKAGNSASAYLGAKRA
jgi:hypothetical protein